MVQLRVTFEFEQRKYGWSETFFNDSGAINDVTVQVALDWLRARRQLLAPDSRCTKVRLSDDEVQRDSRSLSPAANIATGTWPSGVTTDFATTALQLRCEAGTLHHRVFDMRGIPDAICVDGLYDPTALAGWNARLTTFRNVLTSAASNGSHWCIKGLIFPGIKGKIVGIEQSGGNTIVTTLLPHGMTGIVRLRISGVLGAVPINGTYVASVLGTDTFKLLAAPSITPYRVGGSYRKVDASNFDLFPIDSTSTFRISKRDTGRPSDLPRGRRSKARR